MKYQRSLSITLILALVASSCFTSASEGSAQAEAINEVMDNINDPNHIDYKLGLSEEDILNIQSEEDDGEFGIKNIHNRIRALRRRWKLIKDSDALTEEEKQIVKEHLEDLEKLREKNYDAHERVNAVIAELNQIEEDLAEKIDDDL